MSSGYTSPGSMIAVSSVLPVLGAVFVGLRFLARRRQKALLLADDWLLVPALVGAIGMGVAVIVGVVGHGIGYPSPPQPPSKEGRIFSATPELTLAEKVQWINYWLQPLAIGCIKLSILAFYRRVFDARKQGIYHTTIKILMVVIAIWAVAYFFAQLFTCGSAFNRLWGPYTGLQSCSNDHAIWINESYAISDFILDVPVFLLPLPKIWILNMALKRRLLVMLVFAIGALAIVGSILRLVILIQAVNGIQNSIGSQDGLILISQVLFWGMIEVGIALIVTNLPIINSLFGKFSATAFLHSIRSMLSLDSVRLTPSQSGDDVRRDESISGKSKMTGVSTIDERYDSHGVETNIIGDYEARMELPAGQIQVQSDIEHRSLGRAF